MTKRSFAEHLDHALAPKRILALDGGGLRGILTIAILQKIEDVLRDQAGADETFRLSDYFDLIGGTSTGAIIAAGLALGMSVKEIRDHYFRLGQSAFQPSIWKDGYLKQRYDANKVTAALKGVFAERTLGSTDYKTGLVILCKRLDTGSQWVLSNNANARYFHADGRGNTVPNKDYPLWSVIRASTAAPTYFAPEHIVVKAADAAAGHAAVEGEFVDGGVSTMNNPALQLVLAATVPGYGFGWQMGADKLSITSVGSGRNGQPPGMSSGLNALAATHAVKALKSVLEDCEDLVETMLQWLSDSPTARPIDCELGTLSGAWPGAGPSLRYHRYNVQFDQTWLSNELGQELNAEMIESLAQMDRPGNMNQLEEIGQRAASRFVQPEHFMRG
ncbi:patatin-like phospholipase family protein [Massilia sp. S19_KUP03_FR1]|uniref:patatin-like phospholipase family protein n=1 Tax=Massilia sp. S19_KUP03_FR1 TaxID=3025503 RepID=UPI002FCD7944